MHRPAIRSCSDGRGQRFGIPSFKLLHLVWMEKLWNHVSIPALPSESHSALLWFIFQLFVKLPKRSRAHWPWAPEPFNTSLLIQLSFGLLFLSPYSVALPSAHSASRAEGQHVSEWDARVFNGGSFRSVNQTVFSYISAPPWLFACRVSSVMRSGMLSQMDPHWVCVGQRCFATSYCVIRPASTNSSRNFCYQDFSF